MAATENAIAEFYAFQEAIVRRMLSVWKFDEWGEPVLAFGPDRPVIFSLYPQDEYRIESNLLGLCCAGGKLGEFAPVLVKACDHIEDGLRVPDPTDVLMAKLLHSRGAH